MDQRLAAALLFVVCIEGWQHHATSRIRHLTSRLRASMPEKGVYDVAIVGSGPAACSLASLLTADPARPTSVVLISKNSDKRWIPNYGSWTEEWAALDAMYSARGIDGLMSQGVDTFWADTDCFFGEDADQKVQKDPEGSFRRSLGREYIRVSRVGLKDLFYGTDESRNYEVIKEDVEGKAIATNVFAPSDYLLLHPEFTEIYLEESGRKVKAKVVVDACGTESPFTIRDGRENEGYQIAYGVECKVVGPGVSESMVGDYDRSKMTLFDYRSENWRESSPEIDPTKVVKEPTFNYVMPLKNDVIFFEETSLVANPAVSFQDCKARLDARLASQGVTIDEVLEEEFCYIPMGGNVPRRGQRLVPVGGAAGLVHPSTGYQIVRCLSSNLDVSEQILSEVHSSGDAPFDPDAAAARILGRTWTPKAMRQRNFAVFGGDFLMQQNVEGLKGFFSGFFKLEQGMWAGFLAGWKNLPNNEYHDSWGARLVFGVTFLTKLPVKVAAAMVFAIFKYTFTEGLELLQSVTPLLGEPEPFESTSRFKSHALGDKGAKEEARGMMESTEGSS